MIKFWEDCFLVDDYIFIKLFFVHFPLKRSWVNASVWYSCFSFSLSSISLELLLFLKSAFWTNCFCFCRMYLLFLEYLNFAYSYWILAFQLKYGNSSRIQERALQLMKLSVKISQMGLKCRMWGKLSDGRFACFIFHEFLTMWHKVPALCNHSK